mgnify:CR=1 FL=1
MKKSLLILLLLIFTMPIMANTTDEGGSGGTPAGFYDDIDINNVNDENEFKPYNNHNEEFPISQQDNESSYDAVSKNNSQQHETFDVKPIKNYSQIYSQLEPATFSYLHGIDPDEFYDTKNAAWSIYPLLRLNSAIYFKNQVIEPGYYLLTPREHKGQSYMLFKQNGKVVHIIPVYEKGITPKHFYEEHVPQPKLTRSQKWHLNRLEKLGERKHSKRQVPVKSFLEVDDLDNYFININIYYGGYKYSTLFRSIRL